MSERLADLAIRECVELHEFFLAWLRPHNGAKLDPTRFERAFDPEFRLVGPDGGVRDRAAIVGCHAALVEAKEKVPGLRTVALGDDGDCPPKATAARLHVVG